MRWWIGGREEETDRGREGERLGQREGGRWREEGTEREVEILRQIATRTKKQHSFRRVFRLRIAFQVQQYLWF